MGIRQPEGNNCGNLTLEITLSLWKSQWMVSIKTWYPGNQITLKLLKFPSELYLGPCQTTLMELKVVTVFTKKTHGRCLTESLKTFKKLHGTIQMLLQDQRL